MDADTSIRIAALEAALRLQAAHREGDGRDAAAGALLSEAIHVSGGAAGALLGPVHAGAAGAPGVALARYGRDGACVAPPAELCAALESLLRQSGRKAKRLSRLPAPFAAQLPKRLSGAGGLAIPLLRDGSPPALLLLADGRTPLAVAAGKALAPLLEVGARLLAAPAAQAAPHATPAPGGAVAPAMQALLDAIPASITALPHSLSIKDRDGRYVLVNASFAEMVGSTPQALVGATINELPAFDGESAARIKAADAQTLAAGLPVEVPDVRRTTPDGQTLYDHLYKSPLIGRSGEVLGLITLGAGTTARRQAEQAARDNAMLLRTVLDAIPHSVGLQDIDGHYRLVNEAFARRAGMSQERLIGATLRDLTYISDAVRSQVGELTRDVVRTGQPGSLPYLKLEFPDGRVEYRDLRKVPVFGANGETTGIVTVVIDITDRVLAEQKVRDSERLLKTVFDTIPHSVSVKDRDARYVMSNPAQQLIFGVSATALLGFRTVEADVFSPESAQQVYKDDLAVLAGQVQHRRYQRKLTLASGSLRHLDVHKSALLDDDGSVAGIVTIAVDITERVQAEEREHLAQRRLTDAIESLPAAFLLFDADERLVLWNQRVIDIGQEFEGKLYAGMPVVEFLRTTEPFSSPDPEGREFLPTRLWEFRNLEKPPPRQRKDGRWVQMYDRRTTDGGTVSLRFDVTELKLREQALVQAQKMEAVGQLTGGVAHDFNNLLTVVQGNLMLLQQDVSLEGRPAMLLARSLDAVERSAALTKRLLAFSRRQTLQPRPTNLNLLVEGLHDLLRRTLGETIEIETVLAEDLWATHIDPVQMENAVLNLAINARDAMETGGRLTIATANVNVPAAGGTAPRGLVPGDYVLVEVSDTGHGIEPAVLERVFDPFFTTKEAGKGSGLGLSMVYGFVNQSAGHVSLASQVGHGTTVFVYLPRTTTPPAAEPGPVESTQSPEGQGERVLIVEDNADIAQLAQELVSNLGYRTSVVGTAAAALALLEQEGGADVLFTDVVLPGGRSGIDLVAEAKQRWPALRVLYSTGYAQHELLEESLRRHEALLLPKPYGRDGLARALHRLLKGTAAVD